MGHSYRDLVAWQKAKRLALVTYRMTESFPKREIFGLTSQLRRCAVSVVSNIAEGQGRNTTGEFIQFLGHARGSLLELRTQIEIAFDLKHVSDSDYRLIDELSGDVLAWLIGSSSPSRPSRPKRAVQRQRETRNAKRETLK